MTTAHAPAEADFDEAALGPRRAGPLLLAMAAVFVGLVALALSLPHDPYIRFQQLRDTLQFRAQWVYERITFDPAPINVAIIGNSRAAAAVSGPKLQAFLEARTDKSVGVANLAVPQEGRNMHFVVAKRLLETRPEVRTIVLSVIEEMPRTGHPAFRDLGDAIDVVRAPVFINLQYANDAAILPYRQMSLFVQSLKPDWFGATHELAKGYEGASLDTTKSYYLPDGRLVDRDAIVAEPELAAKARQVIRSGTSQILPASYADYEFAIERTYTREIARMARERGVKLVFLKLPIYSDKRVVGEPGFYTPLGPILSPAFLASDATNYSDYGHLNRRGSSRATAWLGARLVEIGAATVPEDATQ